MWWPGLDDGIESIVKRCSLCQQDRVWNVHLDTSDTHALVSTSMRSGFPSSNKSTSKGWLDYCVTSTWSIGIHASTVFTEAPSFGLCSFKHWLQTVRRWPILPQWWHLAAFQRQWTCWLGFLASFPGYPLCSGANVFICARKGRAWGQGYGLPTPVTTVAPTLGISSQLQFVELSVLHLYSFAVVSH